LIQIQNFTKRYGDRDVVKNLSFTVKDGAITGFIGHNGAGKSTTIKAVTGVIRPTEGTITINGIDIVKDPQKAKTQFGYVSDSPDHFLRLKGIEYLNFMADIYDTPAEGRGEFIESYAKRFGIYDALNNQILSYSHGMRQKIMIMGALIHDPWNWILDGNYGDTVGKVRDHTANGGTQFPAKWPDFWYDKMSPEVGSEVYLNEQRIKSGSHGKVLLPTMRYTTEQTEELAGLVVAIKAYMDEYEANVVTGKLDLEDSWEEYLNTMKAMGAERVAEIYSDVYAVSKK